MDRIDPAPPARFRLRSGRRAGFLAALVIALILLALGCFGSPSSDDEGSNGTTSSDPGVFLSTTNDSGLATVTNDSGDVVLVAETRDSLGAPIPGLMVTYLDCSPEPMVAFNADSGEAVGTFLIAPGDAAKQDEPGVSAGVFILSLLDPTYGRLYDPQRDDFATGVQNNIASIRGIVGYDNIQLILDTTPGLVDTGIKTKAELMAEQGPYEKWLRLYDESPTFTSSAIVQRCGSFVKLSEDQHDNYRYRKYKDSKTGLNFLLPLGLTVNVQIVSPANGAVYTEGVDREQTIWGALDVTPDVVTLDGGEFHLYVNGALYGGTVQFLGDGASGTTFTGQTPITLGEGETTVEVTTVVNEPNRGFESSEDGTSGTGVSRVRYQGQLEGPFTPSIGGLSYPVSAPCPDFIYQFGFDWSDPDGDISTFSFRMTTYRASIDDLTDWGVQSLAASNFPCLSRTSGECSIGTEYEGEDGGDWIRTEFWLTDAGGRESNHLTFQLNITGDCDPFGKTGPSAPEVKVPSGCP